MSRQHAQHAQQYQQGQPPQQLQAAQFPTPTRAQRQSPISIWVDSTISAYPQQEQAALNAQPTDTPTRSIPPRASVRRSRAVKIRPRYPYTQVQPLEEGDLSRVPTMPPPTTWEYESQEYTAESSLSSLSLIADIPDTPTSPHIEGPTAMNVLDAPKVPQTPYVPETPPLGMPRIEDMDTRPPAIATAHDVSDEHDRRYGHDDGLLPAQTVADVATRPQLSGRELVAGSKDAPLPTAASLFLGLTGIREIPAESLASPSSSAPTLALIPSPSASVSSFVAQQGQAVGEESASWTAGAGAGSPYAQRIITRDSVHRHATSFNVFDRLRWWLLHPGRFEFLLWLTGTLLLMIVTCVFVLMTVFSFQAGAGHASAGQYQQIQSSSQGNSANGTSANPVVSPLGGVLSQGQPLHLKGQGFSANADVALSYDGNHLFLDSRGQPMIAHTTGQGAFSVTVNSPTWGAGKHRIVARDMTTGHIATTTVTVSGASSSSASTPTVVATTTQSTSSSGSTIPPAPVNQTPTSPPPTVGISPTATPKTPTPTATTGITPTATISTTPTVRATTTPNTTTTAIATTTASTVTNNSALNAQSAMSSNPVLTEGLSGGPWLWFMIAGYALALVLLGCAGLARMNGRK